MKTISFKTFTTVLFAIINANFIFGQLNTVSNERVFGGSGDEYLSWLIQSPLDNSFYLIGISNSDVSFDKSHGSRGDMDIWIVKTDANKNKIWDKTIGGDKADQVNFVQVFNNKIYILASSFSGISGEKTKPNFGNEFSNDFWLLCLDLDGNILWQETYGGSLGESNGNLLVLNNGNLLIAGSSESNISGNKTENVKGVDDAWLVEINPSNGGIIAQKSFGSAYSDAVHDVKQRSNGVIYVLCSSFSLANFDKTDPGFGSQDMWLVVLNSDYVIQADKCFGGEDLEMEYGGTLNLSEDFFYLSCNSYSTPSGNKTAVNWGEQDAWLLKIDYDLNILWDKSYGGTNDDHHAFTELYNNKIMMNGQSSSGPTGNKTSIAFGLTDCWNLVLDTDGNILNDIAIGTSQNDNGAVFISQQGFSFAGSSASPPSGMKTLPSKGGSDFWMFDFQSGEILSAPQISHDGLVEVYPNPFQDQVKFNFPENDKNLQITILTLDGKLVHQSEIMANQKEIVLKLNQSNSSLIYHVKGENINFSGKLVSM